MLLKEGPCVRGWGVTQAKRRWEQEAGRPPQSLAQKAGGCLRASGRCTGLTSLKVGAGCSVDTSLPAAWDAAPPTLPWGGESSFRASLALPSPCLHPPQRLQAAVSCHVYAPFGLGLSFQCPPLWEINEEGLLYLRNPLLQNISPSPWEVVAWQAFTSGLFRGGERRSDWWHLLISGNVPTTASFAGSGVRRDARCQRSEAV